MYVDTTGGTNTAINELRAVLGDARDKPVYLETVVGLGYRFVAEVHEMWPEAAQHTVGPASAVAKPLPSANPDALIPQSADDAANRPTNALPLKDLNEVESVLVPIASAKGQTVPAILETAVLLIGVLGIILGVAFWKRNTPAGTSQTGLPVLYGADFAQATFTCYPDRVTASAVAHHSRPFGLCTCSRNFYAHARPRSGSDSVACNRDQGHKDRLDT